MLITRKNTFIKGVTKPFAIFSLVYFFMFLGDGIMSYVTPYFLNRELNNPVVFGLIFASSSVAGIIFDFFAGERFNKKDYRWFILLAVISAVLFPTLFLAFPGKLVFYILALFMWGIYFESITFAGYNFIRIHKKRHEYSEAWGFLSVMTNLGYFIGPIIATTFIALNLNLNFYFSAVCYILAGIVFLIARKKILGHHRSPLNLNERISTHTELRRWFALIRLIWPLWLLGIALVTSTAFLYTVGIVYAEGAKIDNAAAGFILSVSVLPSILVGLVMSKIEIVKGKKHLLLVFSILAGLILSLFGLATHIWQILIIIAVYSAFSSVSYNLLSAIYEDYVSRAKEFSNDIIGVERSTSSIAYIIGPISAGLLASQFGEKITMSFAGVLLVIFAILGMFLIPKRIRIPHKELEHII